MRLLFIDIDNTVANLIGSYLNYYNKEFDAKFNLDCLDTFDQYDFACYTSRDREEKSYNEEKDKMIKIFNSDNFWDRLPLFENAKEVIHKLSSEWDIYFLTSPSFKSTHFFSGRMTWLNNNFPSLAEKVIFSGNKGLFTKNSILIDDHPDALLQFRGKTIKMAYMYNRGIKTDASSSYKKWLDIPDILRTI